MLHRPCARHGCLPVRASDHHSTATGHSQAGIDVSPAPLRLPSKMEPPYVKAPKNQVSQPSRQNHYVPKWYQKGFVLGSRGTLYRLDLDTASRPLSNSRKMVGRDVQLRSLKRCFVQQDLYTTRIGRMVNDEVERHLFGPIDATGALAVRAFADGSQQEVHNRFQSFFEYLDAQKLRTPKGLDWIDIRYPNLTQVELMVEMQRLRNMHCTMWVECVREIVSAEQSDVKFIVTDHPVTVYNAACPPDSPMCLHPDDPPISLNGSQTVFALDANHCLILTNLEHAKDPAAVDPLAHRQNARYSGTTLVRTNSMIRTRSLTPDEVASINWLLKSRSHRFLAAYEREWLFPEKHKTVRWDDIGKVLAPPSDGLWDFGGEMFVGHGDGSTSYRDAFGRAEPGHEYLTKKARPAPGRNDPCGCGSGRLYRRCCLGIPDSARPPWDVYGVRERNRAFVNAVVDILGNGKDWDHVRRHLSDDQVRRIHRTFESLWPTDTNLAELLPRPDKRVFRGVYMGFVDPRTIAQGVIGQLAYFDEIFVLNPFPNPRYMSPDCSPVEAPSQHKPQLLKNLSVLFSLQPFIDAGVVHFIPDPMEFNPDFRREVIAMAQERNANWSVTPEEMQTGMNLGRDDFKRWISRLPVDQLRHWFRQSDVDIDPELLDEVTEQIKANLRADPLALLQPLPGKTAGGELQMLRCMNLELALFVAHLTGAALYTNERLLWRQLHEQTAAATARRSPRWGHLAQSMATRSFTIDLSPLVNLEIREASKLCRMRRFFRHCWNTALTPRNVADDVAIADELLTRLDKAARRSDADWDGCSTTTGPSARLRQHFELSAPQAGFDTNSVHRLLVKSGRQTYLPKIPLAFLLSVVEDSSST